VLLAAVVTLGLAATAMVLALRRRRAVAGVVLTSAFLMLGGLAWVSAGVGDSITISAEDRDFVRIAARQAAPATGSLGIITGDPGKLDAILGHFREPFRVYGMNATATDIRPEAEQLLLRASTRHTRLAYVAAAAAPGLDPIEHWLTANAFAAEGRTAGAGRSVTYLTLTRLEPLRCSARHGDGITLVSARASQLSLSPGDGLAVEMNWRLDPGSAATSLPAFVALQAAGGSQVAEQRGGAAGGMAPAPLLTPGQEVTVRRGMILPDTLAKGNYRLVAGLYDPLFARRLTLEDVLTGATADVVELARIEVR
jgi:hypothetical protein